jgi:hypothetical protein
MVCKVGDLVFSVNETGETCSIEWIIGKDATHYQMLRVGRSRQEWSPLTDVEERIRPEIFKTQCYISAITKSRPIESENMPIEYLRDAIEAVFLREAAALFRQFL